MGPHSFKCGKKRKSRKSKAVRKKLQWGRTLSSAERQLNRVVPVFVTARLQWGRTLSSAERSRKRGFLGLSGPSFNGAALFQVRKAKKLRMMLLIVRKLQWGRTLSSAESKRIDAEEAAEAAASMGPHSFKCGKFTCSEVGSSADA